MPICGWCGEHGHISSECPAKYYSQSMRNRFPKRKKTRKQKVLEYTCRRCGDRHPFNRYCPYTVEPPIIPGECRSCATLTNVHDDECEMVAIKDRIGLCACLWRHNPYICRVSREIPQQSAKEGHGKDYDSPRNQPVPWFRIEWPLDHLCTTEFALSVALRAMGTRSALGCRKLSRSKQPN